jgi:hypothetical protein
MSPFSCPVIENLIWIEPLLRGHLSYKATFSLYQLWPLDIGLTIPLIWMWELFSLYQEYQYCFLCVMDVNSFWSKWNMMVIIVSCVCGFFYILDMCPTFLWITLIIYILEYISEYIKEEIYTVIIYVCTQPNRQVFGLFRLN